jgi:hypothetical protein
VSEVTGWVYDSLSSPFCRPETSVWTVDAFVSPASVETISITVSVVHNEGCRLLQKVVRFAVQT